MPDLITVGEHDGEPQVIEVKSSRAADVHEYIELAEATINPSSYSVGVRIIKAGWSLNADSRGRRRYYPDKTLAEAARVWEGIRVYADHPSKDDLRNRPERSIRDLIGVIEGVKHEGGVTRGTLVVMGGAREWAFPLIEESVRTGRNVAGLSINAAGRSSDGEIDGQKASIVEAITHGSSVDMVTTPAAGGGFERIIASNDQWSRAVIEHITLEELREARPDLVEGFKREWITTRDSQAIKEARAEAEQAKQDAARLTEENRTAKEALAEALDTIAALRKEQLVDRLLEDKKLPIEVRKELREKLLKADGATAMQEVIDTTVTVLGAVRLPVRVTGAGVSGEGAKPNAQNTARKPTNSLAEAFGVDPRLAKAETLEQYLAIKDSLVNKE